jgi:hypothetical protein
MNFSQGFEQLRPGPDISIFHFVKAFAAVWPRSRGKKIDWEVGAMEKMHVAFHVRFFWIQSDSDDCKPVATEGVLCSRERGSIPGLKDRLQERRISIRTCFMLPSRDEPRAAPIFSTLILNDIGGFEYNTDVQCREGSEKLKRVDAAAGLISFQLALWGVIDVWQKQWIAVLDEIDSSVRSKVRELLIMCSSY